jgi:hypothetical protein
VTEIPRTTLIKNFINEGSSRSVSNAEFMEFWKNTTLEERDQYAKEVMALKGA